MNKTQKIILWVATAVLALMLVWPPWVATRRTRSKDTVPQSEPNGYHYITDDQQHLSDPAAYTLEIEWQRYLPPLLAVFIVSGVALASTATKRA